MENEIKILSQFRPELVKFMIFCEQKLRENDYKPSWKNEDCKYLLKRMKEEIRELEKSIQKGKTHYEIIRECADVANFAMMIGDIYEH